MSQANIDQHAPREYETWTPEQRAETVRALIEKVKALTSGAEPVVMSDDVLRQDNGIHPIHPDDIKEVTQTLGLPDEPIAFEQDDIEKWKQQGISYVLIAKNNYNPSTDFPGRELPAEAKNTPLLMRTTYTEVPITRDENKHLKGHVFLRSDYLSSERRVGDFPEHEFGTRQLFVWHEQLPSPLP